MPVGVAHRLPGPRRFAKRLVEAAGEVLLLRAPDGREIDAQEVGDLGFLLPAVQEQEGVCPIELPGASLLVLGKLPKARHIARAQSDGNVLHTNG